jgi:transposase-like protein
MDMSTSILNAPQFHDEQAAYDFVEARVWPNGPACPHCGCAKEHVGQLKGKSTRIGTYKCYGCRKPFTVKVGTIFESSHIELRLWLQTIFLIASSKKGISSQQLHRTLGVTLKTAWFMGHRIREAMREGGFVAFGGNGSAVEVDETFIGHDKTIKPRYQKKGRGYAHKHKVLSLIDRKTGQARSMVIDDLRAITIAPILLDNITSESRLMTDEAGQYTGVGKEFSEHGVVNHGMGEYVRGDIHTNTLEGYFSIFKRGMKGVYQHCAKRHLHRYLAEFDFRYNSRIALGVNDSERAEKLLCGIKGKRLTYQTTNREMRANA